MFAALNAEMLRLFGEPLYAEQLDCLTDPARRAEALDMLDDMQERMGVSPAVCAAVAKELGE